MLIQFSANSPEETAQYVSHFIMFIKYLNAYCTVVAKCVGTDLTAQCH